MVRTTIYLHDDQKERIDKLPRNMSFSKIVRDNFDKMMEPHEKESMIITVR